MAPCLGTIASIIRKNRHTKVVAITDNIIPHEKMPGGKLLSKYFVNGCDAFVAMSRSVLKDLEQLDNRRPKCYTPHPLYDNFGEAVTKEVAKTKLGLAADTSYVLFFGFIREYKGLDLLLNAFADERLHRFPVKLLIAGEFYIDPKPYMDLIESLGITDFVEIRNSFIPNTEIVNYFCASDVVAQTYREATQSGITQIAYHFNKPMITTNVGGLSETVPDGKVGFVVNPDSKEIVDALVKFFEGNLEKEFSANAAEGKQRFSWENFIGVIDELTNQIKHS
jgi:glycosyltransferase involved in cell wall biosynthesis